MWKWLQWSKQYSNEKSLLISLSFRSAIDWHRVYIISYRSKIVWKLLDMSSIIRKNSPSIRIKSFSLVIQLLGEGVCSDSVQLRTLLGGNLALVVERHLRQEQRPPIWGALLLYPFLQMVHFRLPSHLTYLPYHLPSLLGGDTLPQMVNFHLNTSFTSEELLNNRHLSFDDYQSFYSKVNLTFLDQDQDTLCVENTVSKISHPETEKLFDINVSPLLADDELFLGTLPTLIVTCHYDVFLSNAQLWLWNKCISV